MKESKNNKINKQVLFIIPLLLLFSLLSVMTLTAQDSNSLFSPGFQGAYLALGSHPNDEEESLWYRDIQGITHDDDNWYFSGGKVEDGYHPTILLFKVPVGIDLDDGVAAGMDDPSSGCAYRSWDKDFGELPGDCKHFGDIDYFKNSETGLGYIAVPMSDCASGVKIGFFNSITLGLVSEVDISAYQSSIGWLAISDGVIYSSMNSEPYLYGYTIVYTTNGTPTISGAPFITMMMEGTDEYEVRHHQGGTFTPDGSLFYLVTGYFLLGDGVVGDDPTNVRRIHIFKKTGSEWQLLKRSSGSTLPFLYETNSEWDEWRHREPEGATYWDLNNGRAPGVSGELHVLLLNNDTQSCGDYMDCDNIWLKHYTSMLRVDCEAPDFPLLLPFPRFGRPDDPFQTISSAMAADLEKGVRDTGVILGIYPGTYNEDQLIPLEGEPVKMVPRGNGTVHLLPEE
ncbi:MAG: hypothetical protein JXJ04_17310 [Spirochaetales bacterium]|nr:hypothetical protein [Spirochaetales bacterium]